VAQASPVRRKSGANRPVARAGARARGTKARTKARARARARDEGEGEGRIQLHALLCYHECETEPEPVYAGACKEESACQPGSIEERYKVIIRRGRLRRPAPRLSITKVIAEGAKPRLDYAALARWVSRRCPECPRDPCIPLANLRIRANDDDTRWKTDVDISVRPICYSNDLLFQLILGLLAEQPDQRTSE
jgi:hypothetical protein